MYLLIFINVTLYYYQIIINSFDSQINISIKTILIFPISSHRSPQALWLSKFWSLQLIQSIEGEKHVWTLIFMVPSGSYQSPFNVPIYICVMYVSHTFIGGKNCQLQVLNAVHSVLLLSVTFQCTHLHLCDVCISHFYWREKLSAPSVKCGSFGSFATVKIIWKV